MEKLKNRINTTLTASFVQKDNKIKYIIIDSLEDSFAHFHSLYNPLNPTPVPSI